MFRGELPHPGVLDAVRVLVLIDMEVLPLRSIAVCNSGCLLQKAQPLEEEVVEVEGVEALQLGCVAPRKPSDEALVMRDRAVFHLLGGKAVVLSAADGAKDQTWFRLARCRKVVLFQEPLDHARLVIGVVDGEALRQTDRLTVAAQHAGAEAMEGAHRYVACRLADHLVQAIAHLGGGLVREGHRKDLPRSDPLVLDQPGDAVGDDAGLP